MELLSRLNAKISDDEPQNCCCGLKTQIFAKPPSQETCHHYLRRELHSHGKWFCFINLRACVESGQPKWQSFGATAPFQSSRFVDFVAVLVFKP